MNMLNRRPIAGPAGPAMSGQPVRLALKALLLASGLAGSVSSPAQTPPVATLVASAPLPESGEPFVSRLGFTQDVRPRLRGPALYLKGDGPPEAQSFEAFMGKVTRDPVDVVVLGASYREYEGECVALNLLRQVNSCTTIVLSDPDDAADPQVVAAVERAEVVYFRGGDQCNFVRWRDSPLLKAVRAVVQRGGGAGGGSAGLAIQGSLAVYDGCNGSARSPGALNNPYQSSVSFSPSLFNWPQLGDMLTDSHFVKRDRMGRMMAFLCRQLTTGQTDSAWGLGVNDGAAVLVDRDGQATVFGDTAYLVQADRPGARCLDVGAPLTYTGFKVWRLEVGERYDFARRPRTGFYRVDVDNGVLSRNPYLAPTGVEAYANARRTPDRDSGL